LIQAGQGTFSPKEDWKAEWIKFPSTPEQFISCNDVLADDNTASALGVVLNEKNAKVTTKIELNKRIMDIGFSILE